MGPKTMKAFALELSGQAAGALLGTDFGNVSRYRDISIRQTEVESLLVKYLIRDDFWGELN